MVWITVHATATTKVRFEIPLVIRDPHHTVGTVPRYSSRSVQLYGTIPLSGRSTCNLVQGPFKVGPERTGAESGRGCSAGRVPAPSRTPAGTDGRHWRADGRRPAAWAGDHQEAARAGGPWAAGFFCDPPAGFSTPPGAGNSPGCRAHHCAINQRRVSEREREKKKQCCGSGTGAFLAHTRSGMGEKNQDPDLGWTSRIIFPKAWQCCGSGSESGSTCFWASRIWIH